MKISFTKRKIKPFQSCCLMIAFLISCIVPLALQAQERIITGQVTDANGEPLIGASVINKEKKNGASTDMKGNFSISASPTSTLVISYIGFTTREVKVGANSTLSIKLSESSSMLNQVVVIGYGEARRKDITGSISSIKAEDIRNVPQAGIDQMLQGRVAGVTVTQNSGAPGGGVSVKIRGISTFGNTEPLYVVDGVIMGQSGSAISAAGDGERTMSPLSLINPADIESVDVLKDASAAAIYGAQGSNGVVIITTKKGKMGTGKINFEAYRGVQTLASSIDLMDLRGYASYKNSIADFTGNARDPLYSNISALGSGTDWQKEIFGSAPMENYQLSLSGATTGINYYISANYYNQDGTIVGSGLSRKSVRANVESQVKPWLKMGVNGTFGMTDQSVTLTNNANNAYSNVIAMAIQQSPDVPVRNLDGSFGGPSDIEGLGAVSGSNPVAQASSWSTLNGRNKLNSSLYAQTQFLKKFTFRSTFGSDLNWDRGSFFLPTFTWGRSINSMNTYQVQNFRSTWWNWNNVLTYRNNFKGGHNLTVMLGQEATVNEWNSITSARSNFASNTLYSLSLGDPKTANSSEDMDRRTLGSFFGRSIYSYKDRYSITATLRRDRSSAFAPGNQSGYFPSVSAAWTLSNEDFIKEIGMISNLKIRAGYGELANQNVNTYSWGVRLSPIFVNSEAFNTGLGQAPANYGNRDLTWEHQTQWNAGLDLSLLKKLDFTLDLYNKVSRDFLFAAQLPLTTGIGGGSGTFGQQAHFVNAGKMQNKGFDISLNYRASSSKNFNWNTGLTFSHYKNKVLELISQTAEIPQTLSVNGNPVISRTIVGGPVGRFYGYQTDGLYQNLDQLNTLPRKTGNSIDALNGTYLGDIIFKDLNSDGVIDGKDRTFIGDPNPDFTFGLNNDFSYKNFDLKIFLTGSYGNDIFNYTRVWGESMSATSGNQMATVVQRWTPENTGTTMPRYANGDPNENARISDRFIEDGSYLRIQNITLGYALPKAVSNRLKIVDNMRIYASVQNAYTFTKYSGFDPEVGSVNSNIFLSGIDLGRYPIARTFTFGLNLGF